MDGRRRRPDGSPRSRLGPGLSSHQTRASAGPRAERIKTTTQDLLPWMPSWDHRCARATPVEPAPSATRARAQASAGAPDAGEMTEGAAALARAPIATQGRGRPAAGDSTAGPAPAGRPRRRSDAHDPAPRARPRLRRPSGRARGRAGPRPRCACRSWPPGGRSTSAAPRRWGSAARRFAGRRGAGRAKASARAVVGRS
jgi:hypothetical protein